MSKDLREFLANARRTAATVRVLSLDELRDQRGVIVGDEVEPWGLAAMRGRLVELSARGATATLTTAIGIVLEAQAAGEPVAWLMPSNGTFYPPDAAESGVDLAALVVVRTTDPTAAARAAERLLRSGAFGLIVLDLHTGDEAALLSMAHQGRLVTLAQAHDAAVVCITEKSTETASLGSLVSLRTEALRAHSPDGSGGFEVTIRALKDKRRGPGWTRAHKLRGPAGL